MTAALTSAIMAANKNETGSTRYGRGNEPYTDLQAWGMRPLHSQREGANRKLANSNATLVGVVNWVTANPRKFLHQNLI